MNDVKNITKGINRKKADLFIFAISQGVEIEFFEFTPTDFTTMCLESYRIDSKSDKRIEKFEPQKKHYRFKKVSCRKAMNLSSDINYKTLKKLYVKDYTTLIPYYENKYHCCFNQKAAIEKELTYYTFGDMIEMIILEFYGIEWKKSNSDKFDFTRNTDNKNIEIKSFIQNSFEIQPKINQYI